MAYGDKTILRDADGNPIPQIWDDVANDFVPYQVTTYYGLSADTKPTVTTVGIVYFAIDTGTVYMWDGTSWTVI